MAGVLGLLDDVDVPVLGQLPSSLLLGQVGEGVRSRSCPRSECLRHPAGAPCLGVPGTALEGAGQEQGGVRVGRLTREQVSRGRLGAIFRRLFWSSMTDPCEPLGSTDEVLTTRLRELCAAGLATRGVDEGPPVRVEYLLTPAGRDLRPVLNAVERYGAKHHDLLEGFGGR